MAALDKNRDDSRVSFLFDEDHEEVLQEHKAAMRDSDINSADVVVARRDLTENSKPMDLSKELRYAKSFNESKRARKLINSFCTIPGAAEMTGIMLLRRGKIFAKETRDGLFYSPINNGGFDTHYPMPYDPHERQPMYSVTKTITGLIFGRLIDEGKLSLHDTLGDIFPDEDNWSLAEDAEERKKFTIHELLTMTTGLYAVEENCKPKYSCGGENLAEALAEWCFDSSFKGGFHYYSYGGIYSQIILKRSGMTPKEYFATHFVPHLGIKEHEWEWLNLDSTDKSGYYAGPSSNSCPDPGEPMNGLLLTLNAMAKIGQLILQK